MISQKKHLTTEGLQQIVNLKAALNKGLSDNLNLAFPNAILIISFYLILVIRLNKLLTKNICKSFIGFYK